MTNRPLVLGPEQHARIAAVKAYAEANPVSLVRLYRMAHGKDSTRLDGGHLALIPVGFRVGYVIEEQQIGKLRHFTASVDGETNLVHPAAVEALLDAFGMPTIAAALFVRAERSAGQERRNIFHVLAPLPTVAPAKGTEETSGAA